MKLEKKLSLALAVVVGLSSLSLSAAKKQDDIKQLFARGVYWPWEQTGSHAKAAGMEKLKFVEHFMNQIKNDWHCNVIWFVNGPRDKQKIAEIAAKYQLKLLYGTDLAGLFVHGISSQAQLDKKVASSVDKLKDLPGFGAYVLKDEARSHDAPIMEMCRKKINHLDPAHPCIVVTMSHDSERYVYETGFPIICSDIYHFGAPRSPNIPNTPRISKRTFRGSVQALVTMCQDRGKTPWVMPQCFADAWGPWWLDEKENLVIEPGAYYHWRTPTPAEVKWQIWESVRAGVKGVVFFSPLLGSNNRYGWTPKDKMPEKMKKRIEQIKKRGLPVLRKRLNTGSPRSLTYSDGSSTPQGKAMGTVFAKLEKLEDVLKKLTPASFPLLFTEFPGISNNFIHHEHTKFCHNYAVIVNNNLTETKKITCFVPGNTEKVQDVVSGEKLSLSTPNIDDSTGMKTLIVKLGPGEGTLLRLYIKKKGMLVMKERFKGRSVIPKLVNCSRRYYPRGFGMGFTMKVKRNNNCTIEDKSYILIDALDKRKKSGLGASLAGIEKSEKLLLKINGYCPNAEDIVISCIDQKGQAGWNKTTNYNLPFRVPAGTSKIKILLTHNASISELKLWRAPK